MGVGTGEYWRTRAPFLISVAIFIIAQLQVLASAPFAPVRPVTLSAITLSALAALLSLRRGALMRALIVFGATVVATVFTYLAYAVWYALAHI